jgi:hypothetical protein
MQACAQALVLFFKKNEACPPGPLQSFVESGGGAALVL